MAPRTSFKETNAYAWLRKTIEQLSEGDNPEDFLENTKLELFQDQVFCFHAEGHADRAAARRDAEDFAYAVHTTSATPASAPASTVAPCRR